MFVYTNSYGDIVRWENEENVDIDEIECKHEIYNTLDELIYDVKKNIRFALVIDERLFIGKSFYAAEIDDITDRFIKVHKFEIILDIKKVK